MRIKKDQSGWHASGVLVRDARHERTPSETGRHLAKKDTKRWCKGKVGREHQGEWRPYDDVKNMGRPHGRWRILVCTACGRHLDHDYPWS